MMKTRQIPYALAVLLAGIAFHDSAFSADECKIKYGYHTGSGQNRNDREKIAYIDLGDTLPINQSNMNYVKNLRTPKVKFYLQNAQNVTLDKNFQNPPALFYPNQVKLVKAKCLPPGSNAQTPAAMAQAMKLAGNTASQAANAIKNWFNASRKQVAIALKQAGYTVDQIAAGVRSAFNSSRKQVAIALKQAGYTVSKVAAGVRSAFNASRKQVAIALKQAGYTVDQIAAGIKSAFNANAEQIAKALDEAGYTAQQITSALKSLGYPAEMVAIAMLGVSNFTEEQLRSLLVTANYALAQINEALNNLFENTQPVITGITRPIQDTVNSAVANTMKLRYVFHGSNYPVNLPGCYWPSGNSLYGDTRSNPIPLSPTRRSIVITAWGDNLATANGVQGLPRGANATIIEKGQCAIRIRINMPPSGLRNGMNGTARLRTGRQAGPGFHWVIGTQPPRAAGSGPIPTRPPRPGSGTDLVPANVNNTLYVLATGYIQDKSGQMFVPLTSNAHCQGMSAPGLDGNYLLSQSQSITVSDIVWGVHNNGQQDATGNFLIQLLHGNQVVASRTLNSLPAGAVRTYRYSRPVSTTTVARVGLESDCFHMGTAREGWNDNKGYTVRVDVNNTVNETNESNNSNRL